MKTNYFYSFFRLHEKVRIYVCISWDSNYVKIG